MALIGTSLSAKVYTALYTSQVSDAAISVSSVTLQGRTETVLDFNSGHGLISRDLETAFSWPISQGTVLYVWQPSMEPYPENTYDRATPWVDFEAAKFVQGYSIMADSFNVPKFFQLESGDDHSLHSFVEIPGGGVAFNEPMRKVFSCVPFVCHSLRRVTDDGVAWRVFNEEPIFQPYPEMQENWTTELTSLGGVGWQHLREMNIAYLSTTAITLTFSVDSGNGSIAPVTVTIPSSSGTQTKLKVVPTYNKWKLLGFTFTSSAPFALWLPDLQLKIRSWGEVSAYRVDKPFGGESSPSAAV
jgi:hypothetical protein